MKDRRITPHIVAKSAKVSTSTVRNWANKGRLPHTRDWNGTRVFTKEAIKIAKNMAGLKSER